MGCAGSTPKRERQPPPTLLSSLPNFVSPSSVSDPRIENSKRLQKPKSWKHTEPITRTQLRQMRDEFWDTAPHYGGQKEIWDALRAAAEADLNLAQVIVETAGIIVSSADIALCYDEKGAKYELPKYVLSDPTNIVEDS
ncbi:uncharacterized protein [Typha latifolia]|uniref:uncharacterized protein n=1 Tax=Typha latifolia TaxID=4733 RepID=UPI003C30CD09